MSEESRDLVFASIVFALAFVAWRRRALVANIEDVKERIADYAA